MPIRICSTFRCTAFVLLAAGGIANELGAQQPRATGRRTIVAVAEPTVDFRSVGRPARDLLPVSIGDSAHRTMQGATPRSRSRGARRGFVIGLVGGALFGLAVTNDFLDEPGVNMVVSAGFFGLVGAGVGALIGAAPDPATGAGDRPPPPR